MVRQLRDPLKQAQAGRAQAFVLVHYENDIEKPVYLVPQPVQNLLERGEVFRFPLSRRLGEETVKLPRFLLLVFFHRKGKPLGKRTHDSFYPGPGGERVRPVGFLHQPGELFDRARGPERPVALGGENGGHDIVPVAVFPELYFLSLDQELERFAEPVLVDRSPEDLERRSERFAEADVDLFLDQYRDQTQGAAPESVRIGASRGRKSELKKRSEGIEPIRDRKKHSRSRLGKSVSLEARPVVFGDRGRHFRFLAAFKRVVHSHYALKTRHLDHHGGRQIRLGEKRGPPGHGKVPFPGENARTQFGHKPPQPLGLVPHGTQVLLEGELLERGNETLERFLSVLAHEVGGVGVPRPDHIFVPPSHEIGILGFSVRNDHEMGKKISVLVPYREIPLVFLHDGDKDFRGKLEVTGIETPQNRERRFHKIGHLVEKSGIFFQSASRFSGHVGGEFLDPAAGAVTDNGDGTYTLTWSYKNVGDYNQDGIVNIMDITPLAVHFNETADETNELIDGNEDTVIDIKDITPLAANFLTEVAGYVIEGAPSEFSEFSEVDRAPFVYEEGLSERKGLEYVLSEENAGDLFYFRVVAYDGEGNLSDVFSNAARRPFIPGNPPEIGSISELAGDSGSAQVFTAQVSGDTPISYRIDFAGGAEPSVITGVIESYEGDHAELTANITLSRGGDLLEPTKNYPAKLTLTNASGEASSDILLSVTAIWHIEEIPKVPGYEEFYETAIQQYDLSPDGSLWGVHTYEGVGPPRYLIHVVDGVLEHYEELPWDKAGNLTIDRNGNPALVRADKVPPELPPTYEYYLVRKVQGAWEAEKLDFPASKLFFDSQNRPVIVFSRRLGFNSSDLWVARKPGEEWELTQVRDAGLQISFYATLDRFDRLRLLYRSYEGTYDYGYVAYVYEDEDGWHEDRVFEGYKEGERTVDCGPKGICIENGNTLGLFWKYDSLQPGAEVLVGMENAGMWSFESVTSYAAGSMPGGWGLATLLESVRVAFIYYYSNGIASFHVSESGSPFTSVQFSWGEVSSEPDIVVTPDGSLAVVTEDSIREYW